MARLLLLDFHDSRPCHGQIPLSLNFYFSRTIGIFDILFWCSCFSFSFGGHQIYLFLEDLVLIVPELVPVITIRARNVLGFRSMEPSNVGSMGEELEGRDIGSSASSGARSWYLSLMENVAPKAVFTQPMYGS